MNQSLASLLTGGQKTLSLNISQEGSTSLKEGDLLALTVKESTGDGKTVLSIAGSDQTISLDGSLPEGSKILARVKSADQSKQLKLLHTLREFKKIQTRELLKLVQPMDVSSTTDVLDQVREQLRHRGFFEPSKISSPQESSAKPAADQLTPTSRAETSDRGSVIRLTRSLPESQQLQKNQTVQSYVENVSSDNKMTLNIQGRSVEAHVPSDTNFNRGDVLQLSVVETGDEPRLEVINRVSQSKVPEEKIQSLLDQLNVKSDREAVEQSASIIHSSRNESHEQTLRRITIPEDQRREFSSDTLNRARDVIQTQRSESSLTMDNQPLNNLFERLNIELNEASLKQAKEIINENPDIGPREFITKLTSTLSPEQSDPFKEFNPRLINQAREAINTLSSEAINQSRPDATSTQQSNASNTRSRPNVSTETSQPPPASRDESDQPRRQTRENVNRSDGANREEQARENNSRPSNTSESTPSDSSNNTVKREDVKTLLADMNRSTSSEAVERVRQFVSEQPEAKPVELLRFVRDQLPFQQSADLEQARDTLEDLRQFFQKLDRNETLPPKNEIDRTDLKAMIKDLGMKPEKSVVKLAESLLDVEDQPSKKLLAKVLSNRSLAQDGDGNVDQDKLKKLVSMLKRNFPVNERMFNQVSRESTMDSMAEIWNKHGDLPRLNPGEGNLKQQIQDVLQSMGFDFEAQLQKNTSDAIKTLRAALMNLVSGGETAQTQSMASDVSQSDARSMLSQIVKHSLASRAEDGSLFLFVPFQDGDESKMMKVRVQDERNDLEKQLNRQWGVTLEVSLSMIGDLRIHARRREDKLGVRFEAGQANAVRLIRENREWLTEELNNLGYDPQVKVERMEGDFSDWVDKNLYDVPETGSGSLDLTI